jgi:hypothetical protein
MAKRYRVKDLRNFTFDLLCKKGLHSDPAKTVIDILLDPFDNFSALQNFKEKA